MKDIKNAVTIRDNGLTDELRYKCKKTIDDVKKLSYKERQSHYEELFLLLKELLKNKNKNFNEFIKSIRETPYFESLEIGSILDKETEKFIDEIFSILTGDIS